MSYRHTTLRKTVGSRLKLLLKLQLLGYESTVRVSSMSAIDNLILGARLSMFVRPGSTTEEEYTDYKTTS